jgi:hypothetical protein
MYKAFSPVAWEWSAVCRKEKAIRMTTIYGREIAYRMHAHDRMVILHRLSANELAISPRVFGLSETVVLSLQAFKQTLDRI